MDDQQKAKMAQRMGQMHQPQITADMVKNSRSLKCSCGGEIYLQGVLLKKLSALLSPTGKEEQLPIQVLYCKDCGLIHPETDPDNVIPEHLKSKSLKIETL
ncbi:MAG: hypothetical protein HC831_18985 [Chloroflexia bacterium]|nr:hypothetical protein [Chloroflexia bacterium]